MSSMATAAKVTYPHIVKEAEYCGGKAAIDVVAFEELAAADGPFGAYPIVVLSPRSLSQ